MAIMYTEGLNAYMRAIETNWLEDEQIVRLIEMAQQGDERARNTAVENCLRLVVKVAAKMCRQQEHWEFADSIAYGNLGLFYAIEKFKPDSGTPFMVYAVRSIRWTIRWKMSLHARPQQPTIPMDEDERKGRTRSTARELDWDEEAMEPWLESALGRLKPSYRQIVQMRMGLDGRDAMTFDAIAQATESCNREVVRTKFVKAVAKLKRDWELHHLHRKIKSLVAIQKRRLQGVSR